MATYQTGNTVTSWCEFRVLDVAELPTIKRALTNPTTVTVTVTNPNGVITNPSATNVSTGVYYVNVLGNVAGTWTVDWLGTGAAAGVAKTQSFSFGEL